MDGPVLLGVPELYFDVLDCAAGKGNKLKSKPRRSVGFDPTRLLCNEFACSKLDRWKEGALGRFFVGPPLYLVELDLNMNNSRRMVGHTYDQKDRRVLPISGCRNVK